MPSLSLRSFDTVVEILNSLLVALVFPSADTSVPVITSSVNTSIKASNLFIRRPPLTLSCIDTLANSIPNAPRRYLFDEAVETVSISYDSSGGGGRFVLCASDLVLCYS
jgi:hypothetical protein